MRVVRVDHLTLTRATAVTIDPRHRLHTAHKIDVEKIRDS
jgi:DNA-directed RNA polymerase alpha subunit